MQDGPRYLTETDLQTLTITKQTSFGAVGVTGDGRKFAYVSFGGTATVAPGLLMVTPALKANAAGLTITAAGTSVQSAANLLAGSRTLVLTNSSTAVTQDEFAEGYLEVQQTSGTSEGPIAYKIAGNSAAAATTGYVIVTLAEPLRNAETLVSGTDLANLTQSPCQAVVASLTQSNPVGVTPLQVVNTSTVTNYGWVQTSGHAYLKATSGTKGFPVTQDLAGTAGFVANTGAGAAETVPTIGIFKESASNTLAPVELKLS
jgi:hypothetical protein